MLIKPDSKKGKEFGFTSDKFTLDSYLTLDSQGVVVSLLLPKDIVHQQSNICSLLNTLYYEKGYTVAVPNPDNLTLALCKGLGFKPTMIDFGGDKTFCMYKEKVNVNTN